MADNNIHTSADAKNQGVETELKQIAKLIDSIKLGSKHTEDAVKKQAREIEVIKGKQARDANILAKLEYLLTSRNQSRVTGANISSPDAQKTSELTPTVIGNAVGSKTKMPNIMSMVFGALGFASKPLGGNFPGFDIKSPFSGLGGHRTYKGGGGLQVGQGEPQGADASRMPEPAGQVATPLSQEKTSVGGYSEVKKSSLVSPLATPKEKQPHAIRQNGIDRSRFIQELKDKPKLKEKLLAIAAGENNDPTGNRAVIETMMNRASMMGTSLETETRLHPSERGYYAGYNPRALNNPKTRAMIEGNLDAVLKGSNVSNFATDNASGAFGRRRMASGMYKLDSSYGGEYYTHPNRSDARGFGRYEAWRAKAQQEEENSGVRLIRAPSLAGGQGQQQTDATRSARLTIIGNAASSGANRDLIKAATEASKHLPEGWRVEAFSGFRPGSHGLHGSNDAVDFQLYDEKGQKLKNYQTPETFRVYEKFAQDSHKALADINPSLAKLHRWGGYFGGELGRTYGAADLMHQDFGGKRFGINERTGESGGMAAGSWKGGLNQDYSGVFDTEKDKSKGMGEVSKYRYSDADIRKPTETDVNNVNKEVEKKSDYSRLSPQQPAKTSTGEKEKPPVHAISQRFLDIAKQTNVLVKADAQAQKTAPENISIVQKQSSLAQTAPTDIRPGQIKQSAIDAAREAKASTTMPESKQPMKLQENIKPQQAQGNLSVASQDNAFHRQIPHESTIVHPSWKDGHIVPSKGATSKVEAGFIRLITGKDSSFSSASLAASQ